MCTLMVTYQPFTFPHERSPHYTIVYTFTRRVLCQILRATKLTPTPYQFGSHAVDGAVVDADAAVHVADADGAVAGA